ncbi:MAG: signal peptidase II [Eubacterium sp.]|nr:signal peptidase II [Eubacterium sp.]
MNNLKKIGMKTHAIFAAVFILLIAIDRITKQYAATQVIKGDVTIWDGVLKFKYLENRGAAWGLFENAFWLFYIVTFIVIIIMAYMYSKISFDKKFHFLRFLLIMLCAGAVGNFIDRALYKYVIDFIYIEFIDFPVFNVADIYVTVSVLLLVFALFFIYNKEPLFEAKKESQNDENIDSVDKMSDSEKEENNDEL